MISALRVPAGYGQLDYSLSRIHGLLGRLPHESSWTALSPIERQEHFLDAAGKQQFGYWLGEVRAGHNVHEIETALRLRYRHEMMRVQHWAPTEFQPLLEWFGLLPYLDFVGYLHRGESTLHWMQADDVLAGWIATGGATGSLAQLQRGLETGHGRHRVGRNWLDGLWSRLPPELEGLAEDRRFGALLRLMVEAHPVHDAGRPAEQGVHRQLLREAHRRVMTPPLIPLYAMLAHWLLLRLRGELVVRATALAGM